MRKAAIFLSFFIQTIGEKSENWCIFAELESVTLLIWKMRI